MRHYFNKKNVDIKLRENVMNYLSHKSKEDDQDFLKEEEEEIISQLPKELKRELEIQDKLQKIKQFKFFNKFSLETVQKLALVIQESQLQENQIIFNKGDQNYNYEIQKDALENQYYFIKKGGIDQIYIQNKEFNNKQTIISIQEGCSFGLQTFITNKPQEYIAVTNQKSNIYSIQRSQFIKIIKDNPRDYQIFCMMRDQLIFKDNKIFSSTALNNKCQICNQNDHKIHNCYFIHYKPDVTQIILKNNYEIRYSEKQQRQKIDKPRYLQKQGNLENFEIINFLCEEFIADNFDYELQGQIEYKRLEKFYSQNMLNSENFSKQIQQESQKKQNNKFDERLEIQEEDSSQNSIKSYSSNSGSNLSNSIEKSEKFDNNKQTQQVSQKVYIKNGQNNVNSQEKNTRFSLNSQKNIDKQDNSYIDNINYIQKKESSKIITQNTEQEKQQSVINLQNIEKNYNNKLNLTPIIQSNDTINSASGQPSPNNPIIIIKTEQLQQKNYLQKRLQNQRDKQEKVRKYSYPNDCSIQINRELSDDEKQNGENQSGYGQQKNIYQQNNNNKITSKDSLYIPKVQSEKHVQKQNQPIFNDQNGSNPKQLVSNSSLEKKEQNYCIKNVSVADISSEQRIQKNSENTKQNYLSSQVNNIYNSDDNYQQTGQQGNDAKSNKSAENKNQQVTPDFASQRSQRNIQNNQKILESRIVSINQYIQNRKESKRKSKIIFTVNQNDQQTSDKKINSSVQKSNIILRHNKRFVSLGQGQLNEFKSRNTLQSSSKDDLSQSKLQSNYGTNLNLNINNNNNNINNNEDSIMQQSRFNKREQNQLGIFKARMSQSNISKNFNLVQLNKKFDIDDTNSLNKNTNNNLNVNNLNNKNDFMNMTRQNNKKFMQASSARILNQLGNKQQSQQQQVQFDENLDLLEQDNILEQSKVFKPRVSINIKDQLNLPNSGGKLSQNMEQILKQIMLNGQNQNLYAQQNYSKNILNLLFYV
ncbi:Cyclic nucleotide-binding protein [Pseudocohnilembus persalinus]|uniref:Cyclic nucleotide-binding protein n=1 Tax=Pseudocohnilembus persalinus TaxID=266149 RepID=A0A0V0QK05_PSEPJ|nr:Cyclic nucleotide-binding protein [Pseudocohnilembus persalinus]|eukprot:KRX02523.1 Cyclic nucleotide-binding protein [Pseudocohnilembus persalinus]